MEERSDNRREKREVGVTLSSHSSKHSQVGTKRETETERREKIAREK